MSVVVHDIDLASAAAGTAHGAGRAASMMALDAIQGDPGFMSRTCDCRSSSQSLKSRKLMVEKMLAVEIAEDSMMSAVPKQ